MVAVYFQHKYTNLAVKQPQFCQKKYLSIRMPFEGKKKYFLPLRHNNRSAARTWNKGQLSQICHINDTAGYTNR